MKCCPTCGRPFAPAVELGGRRQQVYDFIAKRDGVSCERIIDFLYSHDPNGGPETAVKVVHQIICAINRMLRQKKSDMLIVSTGGVGAVYRLAPANMHWKRFTPEDKRRIARIPGAAGTVAARHNLSAVTIQNWRKLYGDSACKS